MFDAIAANYPDLIHRYGYLAVAIIAFFEGETIVLLAGFAASKGYLGLEWVIAAAFIGTFIGDQFYFLLGRRYGHRLLDFRPAWRPAAERALALLKRFDTAYILVFRFLYGLRTISPFVIGMSGTGRAKYFWLNGLSAIAWAALFSAAGYLFGHALGAASHNLARYQIYALILAVLAFAIGVLILKRRRRRSGGD